MKQERQITHIHIKVNERNIKQSLRKEKNKKQIDFHLIREKG